MSKVLVTEPTELQSFLSTLKPIEVEPRMKARSRLGRTAEAVEKARLEGFEQGRQEGYEDGLARGRVDGSLQIQAELAEATQTQIERFSEDLGRAVESVKVAMNQWFLNAEEALAPLTLEIARQVVGRELELSEEAALAIVRRAMEEVTHAATARIRVNPLQTDLLRTHAEAILKAAPSVRDLAVVDDPAITGGCIIETEGGVVDASVDSQIEAIRSAMRGAA